MGLGRKLRAATIIGATWAVLFTLAGTAFNAGRFLFGNHGGVPRSLDNLLLWMKVGAGVFATCGAIAGIGFVLVLSTHSSSRSERISRRRAILYGLGSGVLASLGMLPIGYSWSMLPFGVALFGLSGAAAAAIVVTLADRKSAKPVDSVNPGAPQSFAAR